MHSSKHSGTARDINSLTILDVSAGLVLQSDIFQVLLLV